jgi:NAD(P)-dependent dehydrogenase (short-subunit alcohol dehydrogenase family)
MVEAAVKSFGGLDVLHNNAAATEPQLLAGDLELTAMDAAIWDRTLAINLRGPMLGCKHAIPRMLERGGGAIVNTSSASGLTGDLVRAAYGASKAGLDALTRYVATQYGKRGIRCNAIAPGVIATPALAANVPRAQIGASSAPPRTPDSRPQDIAERSLASDDAAFITGQVISVDGGLLAHHPSYSDFLRMAAEAE